MWIHVPSKPNNQTSVIENWATEPTSCAYPPFIWISLFIYSVNHQNQGNMVEFFSALFYPNCYYGQG